MHPQYTLVMRNYHIYRRGYAWEKVSEWYLLCILMGTIPQCTIDVPSNKSS